MDDTVTANDGHFVCLECKNAMDLAKDLKIGDVVECEFCGIEYEYEEDGRKGKEFKVIEEEK